MSIIVKIPRSLFERAQADLHRSHPFASERVGFFSTRKTASRSAVLVHCVDYHSVQDAHYIRDDSVGVRIGSKAITTAMGRATAQGLGQIHVHSHGGTGLPYPSSTDWDELPAVVESMENADPTAAHGWMILSRNDAWCAVSIEPGKVIQAPPVSIVGFPVRTMRRFPEKPKTAESKWLKKLFRRDKEGDRYDRQSFLGKDSDELIERTVIGILGLGGGGSHVVQQLAHLGFRRFIICDPDRISSSNLNRMVGATRADVRCKRLKVEIAKRIIERLHRDAVITCHSTCWEEATDDLLGCDLIMSCIDSYIGRRDIEGFCRRNLIPMVDIGMDVANEKGGYEIYGQTILSMPGKPCMHCLGFLNEEVLKLEAQQYGVAGGKPQVVWSNGILASAAVGAAVDLLTDWSGKMRDATFVRLIGSELSIARDFRLEFPPGHVCRHFPLDQAGDPRLKKL